MMNATAGTQTMKRVAEREGGGIGEQPVSGEGPPGVALAVQRRVGGGDEQGEANTDAYLRKRRVIVRATMWMTNEAGQPQPHDMRTTCSSEQVTSGACRGRVRRGALIFLCELEVEVRVGGAGSAAHVGLQRLHRSHPCDGSDLAHADEDGA